TQKMERVTEPDGPPERASSVVPGPRGALRAVMVALTLLLFAAVGAGGAWIAYTMGAQGAQSQVVAPSAPVPAIAAPAAPTTGAIFVDSSPSGATIELGDRGEVGTTPMEIGVLEPGSYLVRLRAEGHETWERTIDLRAGDRAQLVATLAE